ncbi:UNVERIFIED_CONTAM: hypothetical protein NCL1_21175 [Trichonephila clavipes]
MIENWVASIESLRSTELHLRKIAARWVSHALTEDQRLLRYAIYSDHFACRRQDGDQFLSRIITIDEFWARAYEPELKRVKLMIIVAYDFRGVILYHFAPQGRKVTTKYYRDFQG